MNKLTFGSLFAGIGGLDLGLERAGMECKWQVEIDEFCTKVLNKHWPTVPKYGDIRNVGKENLTPVDLVCGGFPCQPFSVAGKQRGTKDDRHLRPEMLRVITELKPTWVIGENVPGIINIFLDQAISDLEDKGYSCETFVLPAVSFDAPHRRDRLFVIANSSKNGFYRSAEGCVSKEQREQLQNSKQQGNRGRSRSKRHGGPLANPTSVGRKQMEQSIKSRKRGKRASGAIADSGKSRGRARWQPEPELGRVAHGVPNRVDRLKSLGNAVVPQVAEHIGRMILQHE